MSGVAFGAIGWEKQEEVAYHLGCDFHDVGWSLGILEGGEVAVYDRA